MTNTPERIVLYDSTVDGANHERTKVAGMLVRWPDPRPRLIVDDHYCSGDDNPYWQSDDSTMTLELSPEGTLALAEVLGVGVDGLLDAIKSQIADRYRDPMDWLEKTCNKHGIEFVTSAGDVHDELTGTMKKHKHGQDDDNESVFAVEGPVRRMLIDTLRNDISGSGLCSAAQRLALIAHTGQVDQVGEEYSYHPKWVAHEIQRAGGSKETEAAAWLHDVVEDTWVTLEFLSQVGFPDVVVSAVDAVTKRSGETPQDYAMRIADNPIATSVKRADLAHNTDPYRLNNLEPSTRARLVAKYEEFTKLLDAAVARTESKSS